MERGLTGVRGVLLDIDGTLAVSWQPVPGATEALARLRAAGVPFKLMTNTTELSVRHMVDAMREVGFGVEPADFITAPVATAAYLRANHPGARCSLLGLETAAEDMGGVTFVDVDDPGGQVDVVVVGGADQEFTFQNLNRAFRLVLGGAALVAMHRNLMWMTSEGLNLDAGAYQLGLEAATGVTAAVAGKPAAEFFRQAVRLLELPAGGVAMVGDDVETDVLAAQRLGLTGVLVRTGKFRQEVLERAAAEPDVVIDSVADLPALLGV
jgi:HAD superfamily hydrolase (TIGR01458 family)